MYEFDSRVRYSELAEDKKLSLVSIINYFQDCCTFEAEDGGVGLKWLAERSAAWMLTSWEIKINRRPAYGEHIHIKTWACGFRFFVGERNFTIRADDGEILIYAYSKWAYMNVAKELPERSIPEEELKVYGLNPPMEADFSKAKIRLPEDMIPVEPITVTAGNLDTNHHVNNAQYVGLALSAVSSYLNSVLDNVSGIRVEYKLQSVLGDIIYPFVSVKDDIIYAALRDADGNPKLIVEFKIIND